MSRLSLFLAALFLLAFPAQAQPLIEEVYRITESGMARKGAVDQTVIISAPWSKFNPTRWVAERIRTDENWCSVLPREDPCMLTTTRTYGWIDSDKCPALIAALEELGRLRIPPFAGAAGISDYSTSHTSTLTIEGRPQFDRAGGAGPRPKHTTLNRVTIREQVGFFKNWWHKTEEAIEPCWHRATPSFDGKLVEAKLRPKP